MGASRRRVHRNDAEGRAEAVPQNVVEGAAKEGLRNVEDAVKEGLRNGDREDRGGVADRMDRKLGSDANAYDNGYANGLS